MDKLYDLLEKLIPLWVLLFFIAFIYLVYIYRQVLLKKIELAEKSKSDLMGKLNVTVELSGLYKDQISMLEKKVEMIESDYYKLKKNVEGNEINQQFKNKLIEESVKYENPTSINIIKVRGYKNLLNILKFHGYNSYAIIKNTFDDEQPSYEQEENKTIWIGINVPVFTAIHVISLARKKWSFLRYICITNDIEGVISDSVSSVILIAGETRVAEKLNLRKWENKDFENLNLYWNKEKFHHYIRSTSKITDNL